MASTATLRHIVYDVLRTVRENYPDASITVAQVAYWVAIHGDRLRKIHIGQASSGSFLNTFLDIDVLVDSDSGRNYFVLPQAIYDFPGDGGIAYISYRAALDPNDPTFTSIQFTRTTPARSRRLYLSEDERPSPSNPYFYRSKSNVFFLGVEQLNLLTVEAGLFTSLQPVDSTLDLDEVFDFPQELLPQLKEEVVGLGLFIKKLPEEYEVEIKNRSINILTNKDIKA